MNKLRLARPIAPPPMRDLSACTCYAHSADLREKWGNAIAYLRSRNLWILDKQTEMSHKFILIDKTPKPCDDLLTWGKWMRNGDRKVAQDSINGANVSTVFLGLDHQYGDGPPLLFETMIFGGKHNDYQDRCSTWDEAIAMHTKAVALAKEEA